VAHRILLLGELKLVDPAEVFLFSRVFSAVDRNENKCAIKRMFYSNQRENFRILSEIQLSCELHHPNIVRFLNAYFTTDNEFWLQMELLQGVSLADAINSPVNFAEQHIAFIFREVTRGLAYLHSRRIVHRDLTATNIMLTWRAEIKLIDFGLSLKLTGDVSNIAKTVTEKLFDKPISLADDVWSLGICLLKIANGGNWTDQDSLAHFQRLFIIATGTPPTLSHPQNWSPLFQGLIASCLLWDPLMRATADELVKHPFVAFAALQDEVAHLVQSIHS